MKKLFFLICRPLAFPMGMIKGTGIALTLLLISIVSFAQPFIAPPEGINYQAIARDTAGKPISSNMNLVVKFTIWSNSTGAGTPLFTEIQSPIHTNKYGLFTCVIGNVNTTAFQNIFWLLGKKYLEVEIATIGGSGYTSMGINQMMSVPFALHSKTAIYSYTNWSLNGDSISNSNFIGTKNAEDFVVKTTNAERMRVLSTGQVGIGTSSPDPLAKLEVSGLIKITGGNPGQNKMLTSDGGGLASWTVPLDSFAAGDLPPLFTTAVSTTPTTNTLSFQFINPAANTIFGNDSSITAPPKFFAPKLASPLFHNQGTATTVLHGGANAGPSWSQIVNADIANGTIDLTTKVTGILPIANGGTNIGTIGNAGSVIYSDGSHHASTLVGVNRQVLTSTGAGAPHWTTPDTGTVQTLIGSAPITVTPSFGGATYTIGVTPNDKTHSGVVPAGNINFNDVWQTDGTGNPSWGKVDLTAQVANKLPIANGGTNGFAPPTNGGIAYGTGSAYAFNSAGNGGDVLTSSGAGTPNWANPSTIMPSVNNGLNINSVGGFSDVELGGTLIRNTSINQNTFPLSFGGGSGSISINDNSSSAPTNIGTGTTTGIVTIGNSSNQINLPGMIPSSVLLTDGGNNIISSNRLSISNGGTNSSTLLVGSSIMVSDGTSIIQGQPGSSTTVLHGNGVGVPTYSAITLTTDVAGKLPIANGGTNGNATPTAGAIAYGTGTAYAFSTAGTSGFLLTSGAGGAPTWTNPNTFVPSADNGLSIVGGKVELGGPLVAATTVNQKTFALNFGGAADSGPININNNTGAGGSATNIGTGSTTGTITIGGASNQINLPKQTALSVLLTDAFKNITSTAMLTLANGGTNNTLVAVNGGIVFTDGTRMQITPSGGSIGQVLTSAGGGTPGWSSPSTGTVTSFSAGNLSPLFTTSVATATSTPALSFAFTNAGAYTILGNNTGVAAAPAFFTPTLASALFQNQGATTTILHGNAGGNPSWGQIVNSDISPGTIDLTTAVNGKLPIINGGTNSNAALSGSSIMISNGTNVIQGAKGTTTTVLHGNIAGVPTYGQITNADITNSTIDLTTKVTGLLPLANGGTNASLVGGANGSIVWSNGSQMQITASAGGLGQVLTSNGGGVPSWATPAAPITSASGTINYLARWTSSTALGIGATFDDGTNVGIGTTPVSKLDVSGGVSIGVGYAGVTIAPADGVIIKGSVGIGTANPFWALTFGGNSAKTIAMERNAAATPGNSLTVQSGGIKFGSANLNGGNLILSSGISSGTGSSNLSFLTASPGPSGSADRTPSEKMVILGNGNVGIGVPNPLFNLDVQFATSQLQVKSTTLGNIASLSAVNDLGDAKVVVESGTGGTSFNGSTPYSAVLGTDFAYPLHFATSGAVQATIDKDGNVGIGTTSPKIHPYSNSGGLLTIQNTLGGNTFQGVLELANRTDADAQPIGDVAFSSSSQTGTANKRMALIRGALSGSTALNRGSSLQLYTRSDGGTDVTERMRIDNIGNVGIGTPTPNSTLQVNGSLSLPIMSTTISYAVTDADYTILCTGPITITLPIPAASNKGRIYIICNTGGGAINVTNSTSAPILPLANEHFTYQSDGTSDWFLISQ